MNQKVLMSIIVIGIIAVAGAIAITSINLYDPTISIHEDIERIGQINHELANDSLSEDQRQGMIDERDSLIESNKVAIEHLPYGSAVAIVEEYSIYDWWM
jgi:hypothetical protein